MLIVSGWFRGTAATPATPAEDADRQARLLRSVEEHTGSAWEVHSLQGDGWGFVVAHAPAPLWRWPFVSETRPGGGVLTVSVGLPVGTRATTPDDLGRLLLDGADVQRDVVPPFAVVVVDRDGGRAVVQQDWLGMARLFTRTHGGVLALSSRPSLVPVADAGPSDPDVDAWAGFAATGAFHGEDAPVAGVRLLAPGQRLTFTKHEGGWEARDERRWGLDDIVRAGRDRAGTATLDELTAESATGITRLADSVGRLYAGPVKLGLSGGKDSRVIAAAMIAAGMTPTLSTNTTTRAEGDTASELVERVRAARGLELEHVLYEASIPKQVFAAPLLERAERLRWLHDGQFPSTYLARPLEHVREEMRPPSFTGSGGEILTGYWHPADGAGPAANLQEKICVVGDVERLSPHARDVYAAIVDGLVADATAVGLEGPDVADYAYLLTRLRRWTSAAYFPGMVTPFLATEVVAAAFVLTPEQKGALALHVGMIERLVPEWAGVPFVSISTGPNRAAKTWDGDGRATVELLAAQDPGPLAALVDPGALRAALDDSRTPRPVKYSVKLIEQFVSLAVADAAFGTGPALPDPPAPPPPRPRPAAPRPKPPPRLPWLRGPLRTAAVKTRNGLRRLLR